MPLIICIAIALSPLTALVSCTDDEVGGNCSYSLTVTADADANSISVDESVTVVNTFEDGLTRLVFAFYPDAYTLKYPPPADGIMLDAAYPYGLNAGSYSFLEAGGDNVKSVSICDTPCKIVVDLSSPLALGEKTEVRFSFDLTMPYCNARYGYNDFSVNLTFFFPQLCRYDRDAGDFAFSLKSQTTLSPSTAPTTGLSRVPLRQPTAMTKKNFSPPILCATFLSYSYPKPRSRPLPPTAIPRT